MTDRTEELRENMHWLCEKDRAFAESLIGNPHKTDKVLYWIGKMCERATERQNAQTGKTAPATATNLAGIIAIFDHAAGHLKFPKMLVRVEAMDFLLNRGSNNSRNPGVVYVAEPGSFQDRTRYGVIARNGDFTPDGRIAPDLMKSIIAALQKLNENPERIAADYGKLTGNCCFCHAPLSDPRSTDVGYGPTCADHWGLAWG
jgi:hypothetical protein